MMRRILLFTLGLFTFMLSSAQSDDAIPFNGIVEDVLGKPLKGAKIWTISKTWFARSDKQGHFGLTNVLPTDTLHVKYKSMEYAIPVENRKSMRIRISEATAPAVAEDTLLANTGYGFVKRRELISPSSGISGEVLVRTGRTDILDALQGFVPGLVVQGGKAIIRGIGTINSSTDPLFIVDDVEVSSLSYINIHDVDNVEVLKDGSMYGSRGANGVIIVTTKRGR